MPLFEVFIPSNDPDGFNITARIRADSWIVALRNGLSKLGDSADVKNLMVDFAETSMDITDPASGRVFRITELPDADAAVAPPGAAAPAPVVAAPPAAAPAPVVAAPPAAAPAPVVAAPPAAAPAPVVAAPPAAAPAPVVAAPPAAAPAPVVAAAPAAAPAPVVAAAPAAAPAPVVAAPPAAAPAPVVAAPPAAAPAPVVAAPPAAAPAPVVAAPAAAAPAPVVAAPPAAAPAPAAAPIDTAFSGVEEHFAQQRVSEAPQQKIGRAPATEPEIDVEEMLGELFERTQELYDCDSLSAAAAFLLNLASEAIPSESGAVFISDISANDLFFAAATGPKASEVMNFRVPNGMGIVGFCSQSGVSLAVSDVQQNPQFYANISKSLGYETHSILCSPAQQHGRVFGAVELINKKGGTSFTNNQVNVLNFLAHEFADYLVNTGQTGT